MNGQTKYSLQKVEYPTTIVQPSHIHTETIKQLRSRHESKHVNFSAMKTEWDTNFVKLDVDWRLLMWINHNRLRICIIWVPNSTILHFRLECVDISVGLNGA